VSGVGSASNVISKEPKSWWEQPGFTADDYGETTDFGAKLSEETSLVEYKICQCVDPVNEMRTVSTKYLAAMCNDIHHMGSIASICFGVSDEKRAVGVKLGEKDRDLVRQFRSCFRESSLPYNSIRVTFVPLKQKTSFFLVNISIIIPISPDVVVISGDKVFQKVDATVSRLTAAEISVLAVEKQEKFKTIQQPKKRPRDDDEEPRRKKMKVDHASQPIAERHGYAILFKLARNRSST